MGIEYKTEIWCNHYGCSKYLLFSRVLKGQAEIKSTLKNNSWALKKKFNPDGSWKFETYCPSHTQDK